MIFEIKGAFMKLKAIVLENFRSYKKRIRVEFEDLTAFIGKNDIGKSTILEALEIFFNNSSVKIDKKDVCILGNDKIVRIGCVFDEIPDEVLIDTASKTNLHDEYLLNENNELEIHKIFDCSKGTIKPKIIVNALHPTETVAKKLLTSKHKDLKSIFKKMVLDENDVDLRTSAEIRKEIWCNIDDLQLQLCEVPLEKEDAKNIWESLRFELPSFALFQSDRASSDGDSEVQDPMKLAVAQALKDVEIDLEKIKSEVQKKAKEVAQATISKLNEMDEKLASELHPEFKEEPKWNNIFKLTLEDDNKIPINKRGSGVRRLILLNFFRAQAEKTLKDSNKKNIIYAIEEPETSQHPKNQKILIEALSDLSKKENCQVILTTHVPELASMLPIESIRLVTKNEFSEKEILFGDDKVYEKVSDELGVLPDNRIKVLLCVEGPHDVEFFKNLTKNLCQESSQFIDIERNINVAIIPLGGGTLKQWVNNRYLKDLNVPEIHIYDNDVNKYKKSVQKVNERTDGSFALLTDKKELENYIHQDLINTHFGINIEINDITDIPNEVVDAVNSNPDNNFYKISTGKVKRELNNKVVKKMNLSLLEEIDNNETIKKWMEKILAIIE